MNQGISILQGPHQVAQKSSSTTLPFSEASLTSLPSTSLSVKLRLAGLASAAHFDVAGGGAAVALAVASTGSKCDSNELGSVSSANPRHAPPATIHFTMQPAPS